jgi:electron transport complex protein RnfD
MRDVIIALLPAFIAACAVFGPRAALVTAVCVASCVFFEWAYQKLTRRATTVRDLSACVTGVLLAFNLPVGIPLWQAVVGAAAAIILVKQLFGGLGKNFANPAITARVVMLLAFSGSMAAWTVSSGMLAETLDGVTGATPLELISLGNTSELPGIMDMLLGLRGGSLGETSVVMLAVGGIYLIIRRVVTWHTPVVFILTVFAFTALIGREPVYQTLSGGLFLGAIFMATDYVTTPQTSAGRLIFGAGAGLLTVIIRVYGNYPEGVSFSILLMNILTPYINRLTESRAFGGSAS